MTRIDEMSEAIDNAKMEMPDPEKGFLGLKNRTVYKKNEKGQTVYDHVLGTIINHPDSARGRCLRLKAAHKKGKSCLNLS
jgi:hypothetical protein